MSLPVTTHLRFDPRFVGPLPHWTNGGVVAGTLAGHLDAASAAAVEVRISSPIPLGTDLTVVTGAGSALLLADGHVLAGARAVDRTLRARGFVPADVARRSRAVVDPSTHPAPGCFVCGPAHPDGLGLQPGAVDGSDILATVWEPAGDLAGPGGCLPSPIVWAALDCPAWYGGTSGRPALLGTVVGRQYAPVPAAAPVVVTGWGTARDGRKTYAGAALHATGGDLLAVATSIWIHPKGA